eukprot:CAMPEP_0179216108 /NCGR_PEP_ID=MMETSP0797-20121207/3206_1 /TAXON_ID=47934 /ORGANISM="Dinophysis acuminata, Strain DAEP01" /LENGTH=86 /DNA_ID=CAMNT_0020922251 /DNA_START=652 /DNA_END=908 /DNA_ORIENTATION=-
MEVWRKAPSAQVIRPGEWWRSPQVRLVVPHDVAPRAGCLPCNPMVVLAETPDHGDERPLGAGRRVLAAGGGGPVPPEVEPRVAEGG